MKNIMSSGDIGDVVYLMPSMRALQKCDVYLVTRPWTKRFDAERAGSLVRLLESQEYVGKVYHSEPIEDVLDASTFREIYKNTSTLVECQAKWLGLEVSLKPWITMNEPIRKHQVIVHRSARYRNPYFDWKKVFDKYDDIGVIGFPDEVADLESIAGKKLNYVKTKDLYEIAQYIKGADLYIGNQSSPMAVAIGLGGRVIQETCLFAPDCIYPGDITYIHDGNNEELDMSGVSMSCLVSQHANPKGGWQYNDIVGISFNLVVNKVAAKYNITKEQAFDKVLAANGLRCPELIVRTGKHALLEEMIKKVKNKS